MNGFLLVEQVRGVLVCPLEIKFGVVQDSLALVSVAAAWLAHRLLKWALVKNGVFLLSSPMAFLRGLGRPPWRDPAWPGVQGDLWRQTLMASERLLLWPWNRVLRVRWRNECGQVPAGAHRFMGVQIVVSLLFRPFMDRGLAHGLPRGFMG